MTMILSLNDKHGEDMTNQQKYNNKDKDNGKDKHNDK